LIDAPSGGVNTSKTTPFSFNRAYFIFTTPQ
jgi:hypothetical protein